VSSIRPPRFDELERLRAIERAAGVVFADVGLAEIAAHDPPAVDVLDRYRDAGRSWVLTDAGDTPVAYVLVDIVDGHTHVEQVSVHPDQARRGLGRQLLDHVAAWARARGHVHITLTTFRDVPWNAPYYERCGYRILADDEIGPELRTLMADEAAHGLDPEQRVAMLLDLH
jgi:GNAT superfamily N-acetyltransferase